MGSGVVSHLAYLQDINYRVILCLMKGSSYQGIVLINFNLSISSDEIDDFNINFNGIGIKFLMINGHKLNPRDIHFTEHHITIPK